MKPIITALLLVMLTACALAPTPSTVAPQSPGEIAASYSKDVEKYTRITAQLLTSNSITPEVAQQAATALKQANQSLRMYWLMSTCKNVRAAEARAAQPGSTELVSAAATALCAQFNGQPLDELAQLKLAQSALAALSQQLAQNK